MRNGILSNCRKSALGLHQYEYPLRSKSMQKSTKNQCFSNTEIKKREGDGIDMQNLNFYHCFVCVSSAITVIKITICQFDGSFKIGLFR